MNTLNRGKFLEPEELAKLKASLRLDARNDVIILLAIETGARASELLRILPSDLFDAAQSVLIRGLKGSRDREIPLRPELYLAVKQFVPFNITYSWLKQIWMKQRPVKKKFHSLRHTFALNLYRRHRDIRLVQIALGHASISNTQIYVEYIYSTEELRKLIIP